MEIAHGGFERAVAHRLLDRPRIDPVFETMRGVTMPEFMRQDRDAEFASGFFNGPLKIGLMHPVTDLKVCARMEAGVVGGE